MPENKWSANLSWIIPLAISILISAFEIYALIGRVNALEISSYTKGTNAINKLNNVEWRVSNLEEMCCSEKYKYKKITEGE